MIFNTRINSINSCKIGKGGDIQYRIRYRALHYYKDTIHRWWSGLGDLCSSVYVYAWLLSACCSYVLSNWN